MAALRRHVISVPRILKRCSVSVFCQRHLLSGEILGIDRFERNRITSNDRLGTLKDGFLERMKTVSTTTEHQVFTEDVKTMLHIASTDEETDTLVAMLKRYMVENKDGSVSQFNFGPPLMRLMYINRQPDKALTLATDQDVCAMFANHTSQVVLLDLLYETGRYTELCQVFSHLTNTLGPDFKQSLDCNTLYFAALYKMNTEEALEQAVQHLRKMKAQSLEPKSRVVAFAAYLALNQNQPSVALEICSNLNSYKSSVIQALKVMSYARLGRVEDTLPYFRSVLHEDNPNSFRRVKVLTEAISAVEEGMLTTDRLELQQEVQSLRQSLQDAGLVIEDALANIVERPVVRVNQMRDSYKTRMRPPVAGTRSRGPRF